jgi:hypothetical protein
VENWVLIDSCLGEDLVPTEYVCKFVWVQEEKTNINGLILYFSADILFLNTTWKLDLHFYMAFEKNLPIVKYLS